MGASVRFARENFCQAGFVLFIRLRLRALLGAVCAAANADAIAHRILIARNSRPTKALCSLAHRHATGIAGTGNAIGGFLLVAFMFGLIYKVIPRQRVLAADVWLGALIAALLFTGGKFLIGAYIGHSGIASGFGAAGSLVVVLLWVYFSAQILLIGAEFTCVYARTFGSRKAAPADS